MKSIGTILVWVFLWPILLPIWLWKRGKTGRILAGVWTVLLTIYFSTTWAAIYSPESSKSAKRPNNTHTSTPIPTATPLPAKNVALGKPSSADSEQGGSVNSAIRGNDGDAKTRWCAANSRPNHWWMVDLGAPYDLIGSEVSWEYDRKIYKYKVEVSTNQADWIAVADQTQNGSATQIQRDSFTARGRYVRITVTGLEPGTWASFYEFSAIGRPAPTPTPTATPTPTNTPLPATATAAAQATVAAATVAAQQAAATATVAAQQTFAAATISAQATEAAATAAVQAANASATAAVQAIQATATAFACLNASFGADVTIPGGTRFDANASFVKTWRVKNTGKCDWSAGVVIAFESGDKMGAPATVRVGALPVGQQTDVSVSMRAPTQAGKYESVWRMQDAAGSFFGERLTVGIITNETRAQATATPAEDYVPLLGHLYIGVKIYYGTGTIKTYGFEALGGADRCPAMPSGKGVLVRYPDGSTEWKDRMHLVGSGLYFARRSDPKANDIQWVELPGCGTASLPIASDKLTKTTQSGNLRTGPGTNYSVLGGVNAGETLSVLGRNGDSTWLLVLAPSGEAWISAQLVESISISGLPVKTSSAPTVVPVPQPTAQPRAQFNPNSFPQIGQDVEGGGWRFRVVETHKRKAVYLFDTAYIAQGHFLILIIEAVNLQPGTASFAKNVDLYVADVPGKTYESSSKGSSYAAWQYSKDSVYDDVNPGVVSRMAIAFDLPDSVGDVLVSTGKLQKWIYVGNFAQIKSEDS